MPIETLDDIINEIMDRFGIYGGHDHDTDDSGVTCHCRCCEMSSLTDRLRGAFEVEQRLARQNAKVAEQTPTNTNSPKLPTLAECTKKAQEFAIYDLTYREYGIIRTVHDYMCRQLRAGA